MSCDYPIFLDLAGRLAVVVGGGEVAARKAEKLLAAGARVRVVAPEIGRAVESLAPSEISTPQSAVELIRCAFSPEHVAGAFLVFACTDSSPVNAAAAAAARAQGALVNRADDPGDCDFFVPAVSEHGPIQFAVSTGGGSPAFARLLRQWLDGNLPPEMVRLAVALTQVRPLVLERVPADGRQALWRELCGADSLKLLGDQPPSAWREWFEQVLARHAEGQGP